MNGCGLAGRLLPEKWEKLSAVAAGKCEQGQLGMEGRLGRTPQTRKRSVGWPGGGKVCTCTARDRIRRSIGEENTDPNFLDYWAGLDDVEDVVEEDIENGSDYDDCYCEECVVSFTSTSGLSSCWFIQNCFCNFRDRLGGAAPPNDRASARGVPSTIHLRTLTRMDTEQQEEVVRAPSKGVARYVESQERILRQLASISTMSTMSEEEGSSISSRSIPPQPRTAVPPRPGRAVRVENERNIGGPYTPSTHALNERGVQDKNRGMEKREETRDGKRERVLRAKDLDLGQEGMVPMETNMIMEEMMENGLDDVCSIM